MCSAPFVQLNAAKAPHAYFLIDMATRARAGARIAYDTPRSLAATRHRCVFGCRSLIHVISVREIVNGHNTASHPLPPVSLNDPQHHWNSYGTYTQLVRAAWRPCASTHLRRVIFCCGGNRRQQARTPRNMVSHMTLALQQQRMTLAWPFAARSIRIRLPG